MFLQRYLHDSFSLQGATYYTIVLLRKKHYVTRNHYKGGEECPCSDLIVKVTIGEFDCKDRLPESDHIGLVVLAHTVGYRAA